MEQGFRNFNEFKEWLTAFDHIALPKDLEAMFHNALTYKKSAEIHSISSNIKEIPFAKIVTHVL